jgi:hypothetical protein
LEADIANRVSFKVKINGKVVAAQGIKALGFMIRLPDLAKIARSLAVLENYILIEIAQISH